MNLFCSNSKIFQDLTLMPKYQFSTKKEKCQVRLGASSTITLPLSVWHLVASIYWSNCTWLSHVSFLSSSIWKFQEHIFEVSVSMSTGGNLSAVNHIHSKVHKLLATYESCQHKLCDGQAMQINIIAPLVWNSVETSVSKLSSIHQLSTLSFIL